MYRATWTWSGFSGAPGYSTMYFLDPDPISQAGLDQTGARSRTFWAAIAPYLPTGVTVTMPNILEEVLSSNGELIVEHIFPGGAPVNGSAGSTYASSTGACVTWHSPFVINGRKLRGRTFLVPLGNQVFSANGTLSDSVQLAIQNAGNALANATTGIDLGVWHRPTPGLADGHAAGVTHCTVNDKGAVLRSRRD